MTPPPCLALRRNLRKGPSGLADEIDFEDFLTIMSYFRPIDTTLGEEQVELSRKEKLRCASQLPWPRSGLGRAGRAGLSSGAQSLKGPSWWRPSSRVTPVVSSHTGGLVASSPAARGFLGLGGVTEPRVPIRPLHSEAQ